MPIEANSAGVMSVQVRPSSPEVHRIDPKPPSKPIASPSPPGTMIVAAVEFSVGGTVAASYVTSGAGGALTVGSGVAGGASLRGAVGTGVLDGGPDGSVAVPHAARNEAATIATPAMVRFMTDSMGGWRDRPHRRLGWRPWVT
jgi:hypothetical protein